MRHCRRCESLGARLDLDVVLLARAGFRRPWSAPFTYPLLLLRSVLLLLRRRPDAVVVVSPPFLAGLVLVPLARLLGARVAVDLHSAALVEPIWRPFLPLQRWTCHRAGLAVVTLPALAARLRARGVTTLVLPDPLPDLPELPDLPAAEAALPGEAPQTSAPLVVAICGWAADEPIPELLESARDQPWRLAVTGRPPASTPPAPGNATLTGFLDDAAYLSLLRSAAAIVVLTTRDDTLLAGAWEAIALERPLVLSGTRALRETFGDEVPYVAADAASIRYGITHALAERERLAPVSRRLKERFTSENEQALAALARHLRP
jgi:hypothetical protein